ncbi:MAG: glycosyltransferase family 2 protein [Bacteroidia bacterium]|jgi:glycosyltransferase involved in cell wall biosynthesis
MLKNDSPLFSVVIPQYNRAHRIKNTISSVLEQTYQDFEIIIVDDGSKDNPQPIIEAIGDPRIRYIYQQNAGASAARNKGIDHAKGTYVAFLDSDDTWLPQHLAQALPLLQSGENICTYTQLIVERGDDIRFLKPSRGLREGEPISEYLLCDGGFLQTSSQIIPKDLAQKVRFDEELLYGQDTDFAIRISFFGGKYQMLPASVIWQDDFREDRLSGAIDPNKRKQWLESVRHMITKKAYKGCLGRSVARGYARAGEWPLALRYFAYALAARAYRPKMTLIAFMQIVLNYRQYRSFSDFIAKLGLTP